MESFRSIEANWVSKAAGIGNLSWGFPDDVPKFLSKPPITCEKFPDFFKVAKLKPLYEKGFFNSAKHYRPIFLWLLIFKIIEMVIHN